MSPTTQAKYDRLLGLLRGLDRVVVAFSGGVDSTLLARAAKDAIGDRAVLVTADSETYPARELAEAKQLASLVGLPHEIVRTRELANPEYARNGANRCFFCKDELFTRLRPIAERGGAGTLVYGATMDDLGDHRPGMKAAAEQAVQPEVHLRPNKAAKYEVVAAVMAATQRIGLIKFGIVGSEQFVDGK